ncbi:unnamed protein product [Phytomonas sp. Hart1]|nr:unnamed protein product [Phytomonas sp. Hart1]|eukprot:CCW71232.1 unnamed protein product [Phytomonas sp. isolate Hart1]
MDASYTEPNGGAVPTSYAILYIPPRSEIRTKGYDPDHLQLNGLESHPLSFWKTYSLPRGATYKDAVYSIQDINNSKRWGVLKARLHFSDGSEEVFERTKPSEPYSLRNVKIYDPNGIFTAETLNRATVNRLKRQPQLKSLADNRGHLKKKPSRRTFAPEELYCECPPPIYSQAGFDFTPLGYNSFLLRPEDPPEGVRPLKSNFMHNSNDYRPRSYLRPGPPESRHCHCTEVYQVGDYTMDLAKQGELVNHRNRLVKKQLTSIGSVKPNQLVVGKRNARESRFPCTITQKESLQGIPTGNTETTAISQSTVA